MKKYTIVALFFVLTLLGAHQTNAATTKKVVTRKAIRHVTVRKPVKKLIKKPVVRKTTKTQAVVLSQSTVHGSNANPTPTVVKNVAAEPTLKFASCTETDFAQQFLCLINSYRAQNGKGALTYDATLNKVALDYSIYMKTANFFAHVAPNGTHYYERCQAGGTTCHGENLAKGFLSAQNLFDMWRNSAGHNQNMLGPYKTMGLGISGSYATNVFHW